MDTCELDDDSIYKKLYSGFNACAKYKSLPQKEEKMSYVMLPKLIVKTDYITYIKSFF